MKRSMALYAGILGLSPFFASAALAHDTCFSTGPMRIDRPESDSFGVSILNNSPAGSVTVSVLAFTVFGPKTPIASSGSFAVGPQSGTVFDFSVDNILEFEVQVKLEGPARNKTLLGVFGYDSQNDNNLNPSHRFVHTELAKISCDLFGPVPPP